MTERASILAPSAPLPRGRKSALGWQILLVLVVPAYFGAFAVFPGLFFAVGIVHYQAWFLDTFALLASNDAVTRGLDPYAPNPLDYFHRPHVYSHWWLHLRDLGLTRNDVVWLSLGLIAVFLVAAFWRLRPREPRQFLWYFAILASSPVVLAVERANNDLLVFSLLALLVPCLLARHHWVRMLAPWLVALAALLKYYPAAAGLVLLAAENRREAWMRLLLAVVLLGLAGLSVASDLAGYGALAPKPEGLMSFGAASFIQGLGWAGWGPGVLCLGLAAVFVALSWRRRWLENWQPAPAQRSDWLHFLLGAVVLCGCFFTSLNFGYRWIFAIWLAPFLWNLPGDPAAGDTVRRLARWTRTLLLVALWWDPVCCIILNRFIGVLSGPTVAQLANVVFLLEQPFVWALFLCLLVFLTHFVQRQWQVLFGQRVMSSS